MSTATLIRPRFAIGDRVRVSEDSLRKYVLFPRTAGTVIAIEPHGTTRRFLVRFDDSHDAAYYCFSWMLVSVGVADVG
jgi:hypothetical protein